MAMEKSLDIKGVESCCVGEYRVCPICFDDDDDFKDFEDIILKILMMMMM